MAMNTLMRLGAHDVSSRSSSSWSTCRSAWVSLGGVAVFYFLFVAEPGRHLAPPGSGHVTGVGLLGQRERHHGRQSHRRSSCSGSTINNYDVISALVAGVLVIGIGLAVRVHITAGVPGRMQLAFETISDADLEPGRVRRWARRVGGSCRSR